MRELLLHGVFYDQESTENDASVRKYGAIMSALLVFRKLTAGEPLHPETAKFMALGFEGVCHSLEALEGTDAYAFSIGISSVSDSIPSGVVSSNDDMGGFELLGSVSSISSKAGLDDDGGGDFGGTPEVS